MQWVQKELSIVSFIKVCKQQVYIRIKAIERKVMLSNKIKLVAIATAIIFYSIISLLWVNSSNIQPVDDSGAVNYLAICFAKRRYGNNKK